MAPRGEFVPATKEPDQPSSDAYVFAFKGRHLLVKLGSGGAAEVLRRGELEALTAELPGLCPRRRQYLGTLDGEQVFSAELEDAVEAPRGWSFEGLRRLFLSAFDEAMINLATRAIQIVEWDRDHSFCGRCGRVTEHHPAERSKRCPQCSLTHYPRLAPAVIVLVERHLAGRPPEILLARSPQFLPGMYSTLAGFVEPGEGLEETVAREIREEVGVEVRDIRYFGSQPWPFPHSLMIGFRASYAGGELCIDGEEIIDAGWFDAASLPRIPPRISIARSLIEAFLEQAR